MIGEGQVPRQAGHEPRGIGASGSQQVGGEGRRRRLAVCPGHDETPSILQEQVPQDLWQVGIGDSGVEDGLQFGVAARHGIADDDEVGRR